VEEISGENNVKEFLSDWRVAHFCHHKQNWVPHFSRPLREVGRREADSGGIASHAAGGRIFILRTVQSSTATAPT